MDLQTAADRLGVHYQTAYRWVRDGSLVAIKRGAVYDVAESEIERFLVQRAAPAPPPRRATVRSWDQHVERLHRLLADGDELAARQLVDRLREGAIEPVELCQELLAPVMRRIGDAWADGVVSVACEHRASAICERLLGRLAVHPRGRPRGVCVVTTAVGEEHGLPAAMATVALRADRWQVHHLGTEVPAADVIDLASTLPADLVVLSQTNVDGAGATADFADRIRSAVRVPVLVGRPGEPLRTLVAAARDVWAR